MGLHAVATRMINSALQDMAPVKGSDVNVSMGARFATFLRTEIAAGEDASERRFTGLVTKAAGDPTTEGSGESEAGVVDAPVTDASPAAGGSSALLPGPVASAGPAIRPVRRESCEPYDGSTTPKAARSLEMTVSGSAEGTVSGAAKNRATMHGETHTPEMEQARLAKPVERSMGVKFRTPEPETRKSAEQETKPGERGSNTGEVRGGKARVTAPQGGQCEIANPSEGPEAPTESETDRSTEGAPVQTTIGGVSAAEISTLDARGAASTKEQTVISMPPESSCHRTAESSARQPRSVEHESARVESARATALRAHLENGAATEHHSRPAERRDVGRVEAVRTQTRAVSPGEGTGSGEAPTTLTSTDSKDVGMMGMAGRQPPEAKTAAGIVVKSAMHPASGAVLAGKTPDAKSCGNTPAKPVDHSENRERSLSQPGIREPGRLADGDTHQGLAGAAVTRTAVTVLPPNWASTSSMAASGMAQGIATPHGLNSAGQAGGVPRVAHETTGMVFEQMDGATAPQVVESGPQRLAVGVRDAGLGWVEVHAHATAGQLAAVVATGSAASHEAIVAALPTVRESLAASQVRVDHLGAERFGTSSDGQENGRGNGGQERRDPTASTATAITRREADEDESMAYISVRV